MHVRVIWGGRDSKKEPIAINDTTAPGRLKKGSLKKGEEDTRTEESSFRGADVSTGKKSAFNPAGTKKKNEQKKKKKPGP